jgi:hypothetical protein
LFMGDRQWFDPVSGIVLGLRLIQYREKEILRQVTVCDSRTQER